MDRRLRFGESPPSKVDMWFNELFETGELMWIDQKTKAQDEVEAEIWGIDSNTGTHSLSPSNMASFGPSSSRYLQERSERRLRPLMECFDRIRAFIEISDKIVLSNLEFLLLEKKSLSDAVMNEENVNLLLRLVRNYVESLPQKPAVTQASSTYNANDSTSPSSSSSSSRSPTAAATAATTATATETVTSSSSSSSSSTSSSSSSSPSAESSESSASDSHITSTSSATTASSGLFEVHPSLSKVLTSDSKDAIRDAIVESVLKIFSRWCKSGSPRWNRPSAAYLIKPTASDFTPITISSTSIGADDDSSVDDVGGGGGGGGGVHVSGSSSSDFHPSRSVMTLKRYTMATLNEYILKLLQISSPSNLALTTSCFAVMAASTIVLDPPEKDIPTQVFIHYVQFGPLSSLERPQYWEMLDSAATLMRHITSLDRFLELSSILLNSWNTMASPFAARPPFGVPLPHEAQHLPPNPLMNEPTQLRVVSPPPRISIMGIRPQPLDPNTYRGVPRKTLPSLQHQRDVFALFRMVALWRRFDQGWSEAADDEIHALALTIQYCFVNGTPQAQAMALMAAMGILDALVQSKSLTSAYTITVFNNILTHATMRVALNDIEIRNDWRVWRQSIAMIVSNFDQSFPNIRDTLLLQIVTDVLLEDALNVDYLFQADPKAEMMAETMKKIEAQKTGYIFRLIPLLSRSLSSLFTHTKDASLHDAIIYKLHSYAVRLHHLWRVYQPKYRAMHLSLQQQHLQQQQQQQQQSSQKQQQKETLIPEKLTHLSANQQQQLQQHQSNSQLPPLTSQMKIALGQGGVEKAAKLVLEKIFSAFVHVFDLLLPALSYRQITRTIEALGFLEFAASKEVEEGPYADLLEKLVDRFHAVRPGDNWIVSFLNLGIASIFGGTSQTTKENSLKLDKPSLGRIKQYFTVVQHTCTKYPHILTRRVLEQLGLLSMLFWMLEHPYKVINRKAHQTFSHFFLQPELLENEPYRGPDKILLAVSQTAAIHNLPVAIPTAQPSNDPTSSNSGSGSVGSSSTSSSNSNSTNLNGGGNMNLSRRNKKRKSSTRQKTSQPPSQALSSSSSSPSSSSTLSSQLSDPHQSHNNDHELSSQNDLHVPMQYSPSSFTEEILPYYWKISLENFPEKTRGDSLLLNLTILLGGALHPDSPLIPFMLESLMEKLTSLRLSKHAAELTRLVMGLIAIIPLSVLPHLLSLIQEYISNCPKRLQRFLCATLLESISKNLDYSRKELLSNWYMHLVDSLGLHARL